MPKLLNLQTGQRDLVDDADVDAAVKSGKYQAPDVVAEHRFGADTYVAPDVARQEASFAPVTTASAVEAARGHAAREAEGAGVGGFAKAAIGSALDNATLGMVNPFQDAQEFNTPGSIIGGLAGGLATGEALGIGELGAGLAEDLGGGLLGGTIGGTAEGSLYGAANAATELANSNDPLTAEHIGGALTSNMLLGGSIGGAAGSLGKLLERGLGRAGEALDSFRSTTEAANGLPEDLAGLDEKGLAAARKTEVGNLKTAADQERASLEQLRVAKRPEVTSQVSELADDISKGGDRPIYQALAGEDVRELPGMRDAARQLNQSRISLRSSLDKMTETSDPQRLIGSLEQRQKALEAVQGRMPELQATIGNDARGEALQHVDSVLAETKQQIQAIRDLDSKANPITSQRLTELESGESARTKAIDAELAARKEAANAPDSIQKQMLGGSIYSGVASLMHAIPFPGTSAAAPFVAAKVSKFLTGKVFGTAARVASESAAKTSKSIAAVLDTAPKLIKASPVVASKVLNSARFAAGATEGTKAPLAEAFKARAAELKSQTMYDSMGNVVMRPQARTDMSKKLDPIRTHAPVLADQLETIQARKTEFLSSKLPRKPDAFAIQVGPDHWQPSDMEMRQWARYVNAVENPGAVEERVAAGTATPEDAEAYHAVYPERAADFRQQVMTQLPGLKKPLPYAKRVSLSIFLGVPVDPAMNPNIRDVLQSNFADEKGSEGGTQSPTPQPQFGSIRKSIEPATPSQQRGQGAV